MISIPVGSLKLEGRTTRKWSRHSIQEFEKIWCVNFKMAALASHLTWRQHSPQTTLSYLNFVPGQMPGKVLTTHERSYIYTAKPWISLTNPSLASDAICQWSRDRCLKDVHSLFTDKQNTLGLRRLRAQVGLDAPGREAVASVYNQDAMEH